MMTLHNPPATKQFARIFVWSILAAASTSSACEAQTEDASSTTRRSTVASSSLFEQLWGFGSATTGGLGGEVYTVTSSADTGGVGTLRYGVETLTGPRWIVFDATVFPATTKISILLNSPLRIDDDNGDITIDGRGAYVSLKRDIAAENPSQCNSGEIVTIRSSKNIILTHLDFARTYPSGWSSHQREDCGDFINITNSATNAMLCESGYPYNTYWYDRIWINQSDFYDCGDECIGMTRFNCDHRAYVTISRNEFIGIGGTLGQDAKGIIVGLDNNSDECDDSYEIPNFGIAVTMYQNRFYNVRDRLPRITHGYLRAYNNVFENWDSYGILASDYTRVMIEQNVFRGTASDTKNDAWEYYVCDAKDEWCVVDDPVIWARDNTWWVYNSHPCPSPPGGAGTGDCETSSFPACSTEGGPWYYDCSDQMFNITGWTYSYALSYLRSLPGWKQVENDVRDRAPAAPKV